MSNSMKLTVLFAAVSLLFAVSPAQARPLRTLAPITHTYVPQGFDNNDNVEIMVSGYLPNLCYKAPQAVAKVKGWTIYITVTTLMETGPIFCPQMIVPFLEPVSVGPLKKGRYAIMVNRNSVFPGKQTIDIDRAERTAIDNYIYARVEQIEKTSGSRHIVLKGNNPSPCVEFDRVEFISNGVDTYSVLPIMKQVRSQCPPQQVPFEIETDVPETLHGDQVLLHIRKMDGKSINIQFDNGRP